MRRNIVQQVITSTNDKRILWRNDWKGFFENRRLVFWFGFVLVFSYIFCRMAQICSNVGLFARLIASIHFRLEYPELVPWQLWDPRSWLANILGLSWICFNQNPATPLNTHKAFLIYYRRTVGSPPIRYKYLRFCCSSEFPIPTSPHLHRRIKQNMKKPCWGLKAFDRARGKATPSQPILIKNAMFFQGFLNSTMFYQSLFEFRWIFSTPQADSHPSSEWPKASSGAPHWPLNGAMKNPSNRGLRVVDGSDM